MSMICGASLVSRADEAIPEKPGYTLDFHDEFNGESLDKSKWVDYYLPHWSRDKETTKANYRLENGKLIQYISKDQQPWAPELDGKVKSSAIMSFNKNWVHNFSGSKNNLSNQNEWVGYATTYGYFELRAKLSSVGGGGHQAWWMVGLQDDTNDWFNSKRTGEIDIIETFFRRPNTWRIAAYGWNDPFFQNNWILMEDPVPYGNQTEEYHTYGLDWSPGSLKFYYDGVLYKEMNQAPDYPMGTILNIYTDAGSGTANDNYPKEWSIDYFRVYKKNDGYELPKLSIKSRETGEYIHLSSNSEKVELANVINEQDKWQLIPKGEYFIIKNISTGEVLHNENQKGFVEHGIVPETYYSAQWKKVKVGDYVRLINRWKPKQVIHTENKLGYLEIGDIHEGAWRSQWRFE